MNTLVDQATLEQDDVEQAFFSAMKKDDKNQPIVLNADSRIIKLAATVKSKARVIECTNDNPDIQLVFKCLAAGYYDVYHHPENYSKSTIVTLAAMLPIYVMWLNTHTPTASNRVLIIKDFETFRVDSGIKPQSTLAQYALQCLKVGRLTLKDLNQMEHMYLDTVINNTKLVPKGVKEQATLTNWFEEVVWLRPHLSKELYARIASPKRLMKSFSVTIATILLGMQKVLDGIAASCISRNITLDDITPDISEKEPKLVEYHKNARYLNTFCTVKANTCENELSRFMLFDLSDKENINENKKRLNNGKGIVSHCRMVGKKRALVRTGYIFEIETIEGIVRHVTAKQANGKHIPLFPSSYVEQLCFWWLMCWLCVQPSDAKKLTYNDFRFLKAGNRVIDIQCDYFKTRAKEFKDTDLISAASIEGRAILAFLQRRKGEQGPLLTHKKVAVGRLSLFPNTHIGRMFCMIEKSSIETAIRSNLDANAASPVFYEAVLAILKNGGEAFGIWKNKQLKSGEDKTLEHYRATVKNALPVDWFGGALIKNSAVHAKSDRYRDGHLVNLNSHANETEKLSYLTPENEEWVNNHGRITCLVMNDIRENIYSPSFELFIQDKENRIKDMQIRTETVTNTKGKINSIGIMQRKNDDEFDEHLPDALLVVEATTTVVLFNNYIAQTEAKYKLLLANNPLFLERTVLPMAEWMDWVLQKKFSAKIRKEGNVQYAKLQHKLPPLFENEIRG